MKTRILIVLFSCALFAEAAYGQSHSTYRARFEGVLSDTTDSRIVLVNENNQKVKDAAVTFYIVSVTDMKNRQARDKKGHIIHGFPNSGELLVKEDFKAAVWDNLPPGNYYIYFESIVCKLNKYKDDDSGSFRVPDIKVEIKK